MAATVLVVDDHPGFRRSARQLLELEGYTVVGEAADGATALERARELRPMIALVDVYLPDMDGLALAAMLGDLPEPPLVVLISSHDAAEIEPFVSASGACGFVPKDKLSREAVERVLP